ncbi:site-specific DNA-methyltransferase [Membranihabitans maritimus]|uniref:site-specific DNA-methyltransferase n=1 Tax=Membranihabitans maritimus TaxID=2904244 RepID=UPI001F21F55D|nr:site-specific DNA-methyltransferase [Membranihabitans maritimus]
MSDILQTDHYKKLQRILTDMFQLDQAELDFGIYRIMNQKRREVIDFLENDLLTTVHEVLSSSGDSSLNEQKKSLSEMERNLRAAGIDPDTNEKVLELRREIDKGGTTEYLELEVYSHLTRFFRRYYKEGDFISQRRYKDGAYAIPYNGEEVKLYWANHDQYYIKTGEYFKNYSFKIGDSKKVVFELKDATTEKDNNKAQSGKERRFFLCQSNDKDSFEEKDDTLHIYFHYDIPSSAKAKQEQLNKQAFEILKNVLPESWKQELLRQEPTEKNPTRTLLEKRLHDYTARNTFDYFIHKDLGEFLNRELDFYIKNEILHIDDIDLSGKQSFLQQLTFIKAFKSVAQKIITFLAQIEDFQKKLWLKKKLVVQSDYCITLDRIDEAFYEEIVVNDNQRREWVSLYAIDELEWYSEPLSIDFLRNNPYLMVDTKFYGRRWKYKLLETIDHLDDKTNGLMINSENFQALKLLSYAYKKRLKSVHIDPPYNTETSGFNYKNAYESSSWISFMYDRLLESRRLLGNDGVIMCHIDHNEYEKLWYIMKLIFPINQGTVIWDKRHPAPGSSMIARQHEYIVTNSITDIKLYRKKPNAVKIIEKANSLIKSEGEVNDDVRAKFRSWINKQDSFSGGEKAYNKIDDNGRVFQSVHLGASEQRTDEKYFKPFIHPKTGKECPVPSRGWTGEPSFMNNLLKDQRIIFGEDETTQPRRIYYLDESMEGELTTVVQNASKGKSYTDRLGFNFPYCHPVDLYEELSWIGCPEKKGILIDYFAGSGTTGEAVINLNREDGGERKYIMVEMGDYLNSLIKPRVQKVAYSDEWKNGKPVSRKGISHCFKYMRLESYEDTLTNLELQSQEMEQGMKSDYMLRYMLDVESRDSLLMTKAFKRPFGYTIKTTEQNEVKETEVDLVESFNYLIGLIVETQEIIRGYVVITGKNPEGERILIIWRDMDQHDNAALNEFCQKMRFNPLDTEFDHIYVNGDNNLENLKTDEDRWKVTLIEHEFHKRMWEMNDVKT